MNGPPSRPAPIDPEWPQSFEVGLLHQVVTLGDRHTRA